MQVLRSDVLSDPLVLGFVLLLGLSVVFALVFVAGVRLFPTKPVETGQRSSEWKRSTEIRAYLDAVDEQYLEERRIHGHPVAFYLPERDVAITFDAQVYFRLGNVPTVAILVEHEMPGGHLGARLPFETPEPEYEVSESRSTAPPERPFAVFGLSPSASEDELRAAYRERVKDVHPDMGGDEETFRRVREAYTAAKRRSS